MYTSLSKCSEKNCCKNLLSEVLFIIKINIKLVADSLNVYFYIFNLV